MSQNILSAVAETLASRSAEVAKLDDKEFRAAQGKLLDQIVSAEKADSVASTVRRVGIGQLCLAYVNAALLRYTGGPEGLKETPRKADAIEKELSDAFERVKNALALFLPDKDINVSRSIGVYMLWRQFGDDVLTLSWGWARVAVQLLQREKASPALVWMEGDDECSAYAVPDEWTKRVDKLWADYGKGKLTKLDDWTKRVKACVAGGKGDSETQVSESTPAERFRKAVKTSLSTHKLGDGPDRTEALAGLVVEKVFSTDDVAAMIRAIGTNRAVDKTKRKLQLRELCAVLEDAMDSLRHEADKPADDDDKPAPRRRRTADAK